MIDGSKGGGVPPSGHESERARRPTKTNFWENENRGWGVSELGKYEMERQGFFIVQKVVTSFLGAWGHLLDRAELESKAMWWLTLHQEALMNSHSSSQFTAYAYKSLFRDLTHLGQEMKLHQIMVMNLGDFQVEEFENIRAGSSTFNYTIEEVRIGLESGREEFFTLAENSCTKLQTKAILKRYKDQKDIKQIAKEDNRTTNAVHDLIKHGIRNIASKSLRP